MNDKSAAFATTKMKKTIATERDNLSQVHAQRIAIFYVEKIQFFANSWLSFEKTAKLFVYSKQ